MNDHESVHTWMEKWKLEKNMYKLLFITIEWLLIDSCSASQALTYHCKIIPKFRNVLNTIMPYVIYIYKNSVWFSEHILNFRTKKMQRISIHEEHKMLQQLSLACQFNFNSNSLGRLPLHHFLSPCHSLMISGRHLIFKLPLYARIDSGIKSTYNSALLRTIL